MKFWKSDEAISYILGAVAGSLLVFALTSAWYHNFYLSVIFGVASVACAVGCGAVGKE